MFFVFLRVLVVISGFLEWEFTMFEKLFGRKSPEAGEGQKVQEVNADEAEKLIRTGGVAVLDVRTPKEWAAGLLAKGAILLDFHGPDFQQGLTALDRGKSYLVHCAAGARSAKTRDKMVELGFKSIHHFAGGSRGWESAGKPLVK